MLLRALATILLVLVVSRECAVNGPAPLKGRECIALGASGLRFTRRVPAEGPPEAFTLGRDSYLTPVVFIERYARPLWELSKLDELRLASTLQGLNGHVSQQYAQYYAGYRVQDGSVNLDVLQGYVVSGGGKPIGGLKSTPTEVRISESSALERARRRAALACALREPLTFLTTPFPPTLIVTERDHRLAWQVMVVVDSPKWVEWAVHIDAETGELLHEWGGVGVNGWLPGCTRSR